MPVRVQGGAHAHTDGGMLVWTAGDARVQVRTAAAAFHCPDQPCAEVSGSVQSKGRGFDFKSRGSELKGSGSELTGRGS